MCEYFLNFIAIFIRLTICASYRPFWNRFCHRGDAVLFGQHSVSGRPFRCRYAKSPANLTTKSRARRPNIATATSITDHRQQHHTPFGLNGNYQSPASASTSIASRYWHMINIEQHSIERILYNSVNGDVCATVCSFVHKIDDAQWICSSFNVSELNTNHCTISIDYYLFFLSGRYAFFFVVVSLRWPHSNWSVRILDLRANMIIIGEICRLSFTIITKMEHFSIFSTIRVSFRIWYHRKSENVKRASA